uniref:Uncharacterized protein n=1 Tax=viral metagenome TaxID=1070528 RepID=A0A6C0KKI7_9ZZZZ
MATPTVYDNSSTMVDVSGGINNPPTIITASYEGFYYAFYGSGGFTMDQCFNTIKLQQQNPLLRYDVTKAVQVRFNVRTFNEKIGLYKAWNNVDISSSAFNSVTDKFPQNSITINASEFLNGMSAAQVLSVGAYETMYSDYIQFVNTYFGYAGGFSSLFADASEFDINGGVFDANAFMNIITPYTTEGGENVKPLEGSITISDINNLLKFAIDGNVFKNRTPQVLDATDASASDPGYDASGFSYAHSLYKTNFGMADGFIHGDLIFIPAGTTVKLHVVIDSENYNPLNNLGPSNVTDLISSMDTDRTYTKKYYPNNGSGETTAQDMFIYDDSAFDISGNSELPGTAKKIFTERSTATTTNIDRVLTAPLLIRLDNLYDLE